MDRTVIQHRLKIHVHIDDHLQTASIEVRGTLTVANLRALYVIARRTSALLPGREIVVDLTHARAATEAVNVLHDPVQLNNLAITSGNKGLLCPLRILDPPHSHGSHTSGGHAPAAADHSRKNPPLKGGRLKGELLKGELLKGELLKGEPLQAQPVKGEQTRKRSKTRLHESQETV
ncbi:hypothetical protein ACIP9X_20780 [Arthrobacter sp. NPDC093125]|uniref:hypothetical protein n=1 Tax=Arthrobacter sp. NPDC093125 TaxID=3363944 RepID=UPI0037FF024E